MPMSPTERLQPQWPAPSGIHACCTTRAGGASLGPYASLNLGEHVGDDPATVAANRGVLARTLGARPVWLNQVHGTRVVVLNEASPDGLQADGCVSTQRGVACTVMVADCLPVLFTTAQGGVVAAAHAGWRGLAAGVLEATLQELWAQAQVLRPLVAMNSIVSETLAWLGPCIGPQAFEVGAEVREAFVALQPRSASLFRPHGPGKYLADLVGLARARLQAVGVTQIHGNDGSPAWCTVGNPARYFSHRRDGGVSGRMAACIWLG